jgi:hypothetical protein
MNSGFPFVPLDETKQPRGAYGPPGGGRNRCGARSINMALWRRAEPMRRAFYKYGPPGGGRNRCGVRSINMALLAEGGTDAACAL